MALLVLAGMGFTLGRFRPQHGGALRITLAMVLLGTLIGLLTAAAEFGLQDSVGILLAPVTAVAFYGLGLLTRRSRGGALSQ